MKILGVATEVELNDRIFTVSAKTDNTFEIKDEGGTDINGTGFSGDGTGGTAQLATRLTTHDHRKFAVGNDIGSYGQPGIASLTQGDALELWMLQITATVSNFTPESSNLSIERLN